MKKAETALLLVFLLLMNSVSGDSHWPQFRGINGSGVADGRNPPRKISRASIDWIAQCPPGHSSPVLFKDRIYVSAVDDGNLMVICFNLSEGQQEWARTVNPNPRNDIHLHPANSPAAPTPCVGIKGVTCYFGSAGLFHFSLDGKPLWSRLLPIPKSLYGVSSSPILYNESVIMVLDDDSNLEGSPLSRSRIAAFNVNNGNEIWSTPRPYSRSNWSTPMIWEHSLGKDLVVLGNGRVYGYDPKTGAEKWYVEGFARETIAIPVASKDLLYVSASMQGGRGDDDYDREPFWQAVLNFDTNLNGIIEMSEISTYFTIPIRPELPPEHPGFGFPLPEESSARIKRQQDLFNWRDKNGDGTWTRDEFLQDMKIGRGRPNLSAIKPGGTGDVSDSHISWQLRRGIPEIPSPLLYNNILYLVRDGGILTAVDALNGDLIYRERLTASGQYVASPIASDGFVYCVSRNGVLSVIREGENFEEIDFKNLEATVQSTPVICSASILVRTEHKIILLRRESDADHLP
jgi:outer membrane protein assembly factor BamB